MSKLTLTVTSTTPPPAGVVPMGIVFALTSSAGNIAKSPPQTALSYDFTDPVPGATYSASCAAVDASGQPVAPAIVVQGIVIPGGAPTPPPINIPAGLSWTYTP